MWFWWYMFVCDLLVPLTMIICGKMMWKHPPAKINGMAGYRTARSMKNMEIRAEVLWKIVVEDWLDHAVFFCFDSDSVLSGK